MSSTSWINKYMQTMFMYFAMAIITAGVLVGIIFILENQKLQQKQDEAIQNQMYVLSNISENTGLNNEIINKVDNITHEVQTEDARELVEQNFINAFVSYQNKVMIKELAKELGVTKLKNTPALNRTFDDYPHYLANGTHITIIYDNNGNRTIVDIPDELQNLINPFKSDVSTNKTKLHEN